MNYKEYISKPFTKYERIMVYDEEKEQWKKGKILIRYDYNFRVQVYDKDGYLDKTLNVLPKYIRKLTPEELV